MDTADLVLAAGATALVAVLLRKSAAGSGGAGKTGAPVVPSGSTWHDLTYHGSDLGVFKPVLALPGLAPVYKVLAPINDKVLQPALVKVNNSAPVKAINNVLGGPPAVTQNDDGTVTMKAPNNWYTRNVGSPISHAGTKVVHFVGSLF